MKATIFAKPVFDLTLEKDLVSLLMRLSGRHYDGACRKASDQGGFLFGWKNSIDFDSPCLATTRELDLTLKIMELAPNLTNDEEIMLKKFTSFVWDLIKASEKLNEYKVELGS